ncbi:MAG: hypothetical protein OXI96_01710 [Acidimicrobiaceae bacterium]|nr:hypothetical protein [Acidimicrobiaceae bacterium]
MSGYLYVQLAIAGGVLVLGGLLDIVRLPSDWNPFYLLRQLIGRLLRCIRRRLGSEYTMSDPKRVDNRILDAVQERFGLIVRVLASISAAGLVAMSVIFSQADPNIWECLPKEVFFGSFIAPLGLVVSFLYCGAAGLFYSTILVLVPEKWIWIRRRLAAAIAVTIVILTSFLWLVVYETLKSMELGMQGLCS